MATHSSVLAWRIPGTGKPGGLPSLGSHRVGHDWSDLAAAAAEQGTVPCIGGIITLYICFLTFILCITTYCPHAMSWSKPKYDHFSAEAPGTQWGWSQSVSLESMPEGTRFHRDEKECYLSPLCGSTDICSSGGRVINLRECLNGGTSGSVTRSRMQGWWERYLREPWGNCLIHSQ